VKQTYADIQSLVRHLVVQEEKNMVRAKAIPDSAIVPQGGGVFIVKGSEDYYVDLDGPTLYPTHPSGGQSSRRRRPPNLVIFHL